MEGALFTPAHRVIETLVVRTPLALRFWDEALDTPMREGLDSRLRAPGGQGRDSQAVLSPAAYAVFGGLPDLVGWERGGEAAPEPGIEYVLTVADRRGRYLPAATRLRLPVRAQDDGPYLSSLKPDYNDGDPFAFFLFSAPARPTPQGLAAIRARLWDEPADAPAAHALVEVRHGDGEPADAGGPTWAGLADGAGYLTLIFPAPSVVVPRANGDGDGAPRPQALAEQDWPVTLTVQYGGNGLAPLAGGSVPDIADIAAQPAARFRPVVGEAPVEALSVTVMLDRGAVLRTRTDTGREPSLRILPGP
jgi:hypothetical protein